VISGCISVWDLIFVGVERRGKTGARVGYCNVRVLAGAVCMLALSCTWHIVLRPVTYRRDRSYIRDVRVRIGV
jgi:hypothetical protein